MKNDYMTRAKCHGSHGSPLHQKVAKIRKLLKVFLLKASWRMIKEDLVTWQLLLGIFKRKVFIVVLFCIYSVDAANYIITCEPETTSMEDLTDVIWQLLLMSSADS